MRNRYGLGLRERLSGWISRGYYRMYACPRGKHYMKMSGCVYCGRQQHGPFS